MIKEKSTTLRMVAFLELGIDCVYTIEASLAGKGNKHFSVQDLIGFGESMCFSFLEIYPSVALHACKLPYAPHLAHSFSRHKRAGSFYDEIMMWRSYYTIENSQGVGSSLISPAAMKELSQTALFSRDDDESDNSDGATRVIPRPKVPASRSSKFNRSAYMKREGGHDSDTGSISSDVPMGSGTSVPSPEEEFVAVIKTLDIKVNSNKRERLKFPSPKFRRTAGFLRRKSADNLSAITNNLNNIKFDTQVSSDDALIPVAPSFPNNQSSPRTGMKGLFDDTNLYFPLTN